MKKITLCCFLFCISFLINAQCTISPFIQQNYQADAAILELRKIQNDPSDPDYHNPFLPQARLDVHLEKLSAMYENPQNDVNIDSLFNEFQFHVAPADTQYKRMYFRVDTNVSWVQTLKDTGTSGVTAMDDFFAQYQFSVAEYYDHTVGVNAGTTLFIIATSHDYINTYALFDDLQNTSNLIDLPDVNGFLQDGALCFPYIGIPYMIPDNESISGGYYDVIGCDVRNSTSNNNNYRFTLRAYCLVGQISQNRYVTVSDDCSQVYFSRTLSTEDTELSNVAIYPNPTSDKLQIQGITSIQQLEIYSVLGTAINIPLDTSSSTLNVSSLKNGVYFLKVIDDQNRSVIRKFIKK